MRSRRQHQSLRIGETIQIRVLKVEGDLVTPGIEAD
ncbi:carbon storage regulator [Hahella sp. SMD15-11]